MNINEIRMKWARETIGDDSINLAAEKTGIAHTSLSRYLSNGRLASDTVIAIARAYGLNAITALVDTKYLTEEDTRVYQVQINLDLAEDEELVDQILKRIKAGKAAPSASAPEAFTTPLEVVVEDKYAAKTTDIPKDAEYEQ